MHTGSVPSSGEAGETEWCMCTNCRRWFSLQLCESSKLKAKQWKICKVKRLPFMSQHPIKLVGLCKHLYIHSCLLFRIVNKTF